MARYRQYKNGVYGHRYKGYYIVKKDGKKNFDVLNEDAETVCDDLQSYWDCVWEIDKLTAGKSELKIVKKLYGEDLFRLNEFFLELMEKESSPDGITPEERVTFEWIKKVRTRKADGKNF